MQPEWTSGYVAEIDYTHGYYREMVPAHLRFALVSRGFAPPPVGGRYLELGFGQGLSLNIHSASNPGEFWGTDFNPTQAANAQAMSRACGNQATILDDGFADLLARPDLPRFDYIVLHGIWSWVSPENRAAIAAIARRCLNVGGAVYLSYNALPGWASAMPMRALMKLHTDLAGSPDKGIGERINNAIAFAEAADTAGALFFRQSPGVRERLKSLKGKPANYLAHEYFNRDWHPMYVADVAKELETAKLSFCGSANMLDHVDAINLTEAAREYLAGITHPMLRETARDFLVNQVFRRDVFVRGPRRLTVTERNQLLGDTSVVLMAAPEDISMKLTSPLGEVNLSEAIYRPLLAALAADDYRPKSLTQLAAARPDMNHGQLVQAITLLIGNGHLAVAQPTLDIEAVRDSCQRFNAQVLARGRQHTEVQYLASPVTGGGVLVPRLQQLFLSALAEGGATANDLAKAAWSVMSAQGQRLVRDGKPLATDAENIAQLEGDAKTFLNRVPVLRALGIA